MATDEEIRAKDVIPKLTEFREGDGFYGDGLTSFFMDHQYVANNVVKDSANNTAATESDLVAGSKLPIMTANGPKSLPGNTIAKASEQTALKTYADNISNSIAPEFDPTRTSDNPYPAGYSVTYTDGKAYTFKVSHYGAWSAGDVIVTDLQTVLESKIDNAVAIGAAVIADGSFVQADPNVKQSSGFKVLFARAKKGDLFIISASGETSSYQFNVGWCATRPSKSTTTHVEGFQGGTLADAVKMVVAPVDCYVVATVQTEDTCTFKRSKSIMTVDNNVDGVEGFFARTVDDSNVDKVIINTSTGLWALSSTVWTNLIPVPAGASRVLIAANDSDFSTVAFLKDNSKTVGEEPNLSDSQQEITPLTSDAALLEIPSDARYIYVIYGTKDGDVYSRKPKYVMFSEVAADIPVSSEFIGADNVEKALVEVKADATGQIVNLEVVTPDLEETTADRCITTAGDWKGGGTALSSRIAVAGYNFVKITTQETVSCRITFTTKALPYVDTNKQELIEGGYLCDNAAYVGFAKNTTTEVPVPSDAVYVYVILWGIGNLELTPDDFKLEKKYVPAARDVDGVDMLARSKAHVMPELHKGTVNSSGVVDDSADNRMYSDLIFYPFYVQACEGFEIERVIMCDADGNVVCYNMVTGTLPLDVVDTMSNYSGEAPDRSFFGTMNLYGDKYACRIIFKKSDNSDIADDDSVISIFGWTDDPSLVLQEVDNVGYLPAIKRALALQRLAWMTLKEVPISTTYNGVKCLPNNVYLGLPYSSVKETQKYVGFNVSLRTFMTALKNKRSLLYTENVNGSASKSGYGFTWHGIGTAGTMAYYGIVCSNFVSYVLGLARQYYTEDWGNIPGITELQGVTAANIQPMTSITNAHHTFMCLCVLNDKFGNRKLVVIAESVPATARIIPYTVERLQARFDSEAHQFWSYANLADNAGFISHYDGDEDFVQVSPDQYPRKYKYNLDICTFAGDFASFVTGDDIYINAVKGDSYTEIELYKDGTLSSTVSISSLTPDSDGYVDVNVTSATSAAGKWKARLSDGNGTYSDYCYFERLDAQLSLSGNVVTFSSSNGTPVVIGSKISVSHNISPIHDLTPEQVAAGQITLSNSELSTAAYIAMMVQGDYGQPQKLLKVE